ncbi:hypothetical protein GC176_11155 [bacterium]|nr:hypothetical protein [bacterium]
MRDLLKHLWHDEIGSSQSTEMALVTGVTVGAMIMSMHSFGDAISTRFTQVQMQDDSQQIQEKKLRLEARKRKQSQEERLEELRQRRQEQLERHQEKSKADAEDDRESFASE